MFRPKTLSWLLVAPLLVLVIVGFVLPIIMSAKQAFNNPEVSAALPRTVAVLERWDGKGLPSEEAYAALVQDFQADMPSRTFGALSRRLNFESAGLRPVLQQARSGAKNIEAPYRQSLPTLNKAWGQPEIWQLIKTHSSPYTASYVLRALDLELAPDGSIVHVQGDQAVFIDLFIRTFVISIWVTLITVLLGYPTAWFLTTLKGKAASIATLCVLVPFWTSILVRSTAWFILLQREGPLNGAMLWLGIIQKAEPIIFTRPAVYIAMTHVLLPFFILPLIGVMTRIRPDFVRAAASLGASPIHQFLRVYLPLSMPGVSAGAGIVFMLSVGFYITPVLVGGLRDQLIGYYISYYTNENINDGMAAALSLLLLLFTLVFLLIFRKLVPGFNKMAKA